MSRRSDLDTQGAFKAARSQAVVAVLFVLGIACLLVLHADPAATVGGVTNDYLHAPAASSPPTPEGSGPPAA